MPINTQLPAEIIERKLKPLFWDYVVDPADAYDVLMGRRQQAGPFDRERLLIRLLERLPWYDLLEILGPEGVKSALTPEIIHKLRFPYLKERYEFIRRILHGETVSFTGNIKHGSCKSFRNGLMAYRALLIDNIWVLACRPHAAEEIFSCFRTCLRQGNPVFVASDLAPATISTWSNEIGDIMKESQIFPIFKQ